jgi:hypothetical protein
MLGNDSADWKDRKYRAAPEGDYGARGTAGVPIALPISGRFTLSGIQPMPQIVEEARPWPSCIVHAVPGPRPD